jgi:hypothetical protein
MLNKINISILNTVLTLIFFVSACKSSERAMSGGDDRTSEVELLDNNTYFLTEYAPQEEYGFSKAFPIKVGGINESQGPNNEKRYLNALLSSTGKELSFFRSGSCCAFQTPNGMIGNTGLLDVYKIYEKGSSDTVVLYFNMYDKGDLFIPKGFKAKEQ